MAANATATATFTIRWPDIEVSTTATMDVRVSADALDVTIGLTASEAKEECHHTLATRQWQRRLDRHR
jgi:hypothetical protein